jgi:hypothetical protein
MYYADLLLRHIQVGSAGLVPIIRSSFLLVPVRTKPEAQQSRPNRDWPVAIVDLFNKMHEVEFI